MRRTPLLEKVTLSTRPSRLSPRALALLDVLIGMAIFALIAVIAVIAVGQFRQRAFQTGATSDARTIGLALEAAATQTGAFPADGQLTAPGTGDRAIVATTGTEAKKLGVITKGNRLDGYTYLEATPEDGAGFRFCVEHAENGVVSPTTTPADAFAIYDSVKGGVILSGDGDCTDGWADLPDDGTGAPGDGGGEDPGEGGGEGDATMPTDVDAVVAPNGTSVNVSWNPGTGTPTQYAVYLDGSTTPAWTGTTTSAVLNDVPAGDHQVTVTATVGGQESTQSAAAPFTITAPAPAGATLLRTEVYEGALEDYPNDYVIPYGPPNLTDGNDNTGIRISSAWAGDWFAVYNSNALAGATGLRVTAKYHAVSGTPRPEFFLKEGSPEGGNNGGNTVWVEDVDNAPLPVGELTEVTWVINDAWLSDDNNYAWVDGGDNSWNGLRTALMAQSEFHLHFHMDGSNYQTDIVALNVEPIS